MQEFWCKYTGIYFITSFDPNIYRTIIKGATAAGDAPDIAYALWFLSMLSIGGATGALANYMSRWRWITDRLDRVAFGWLTPMVQAVKKGDVFIIAEVITKTSNDGALVAYEGTVQQLALDGDQSVKLIVLKDVDGFLIKITGKGLLRLKSKPIPNALLQITASEIANVTLEAIEVSEAHPV